MSKRSREESFSPSAGLTSSLVSVSDNEVESDEAALPVKIAALSDQRIEQARAMQCSLPPHKSLDFASIEAFEVHYAKDHSNRCSQCAKNFPSPHYLALHIDENHNPLREELQAKGEKTYGCFVEDCERKCSTPQKRRLHLIDKHAFPKVYNFRIVDNGIDRSSSLLRETRSHRRRVSTSSSLADSATRHRRVSSQQVQVNGVEECPDSSSKAPKAEADEVKPTTTAEANGMDNLEKSMAALQFVPPSVTRQQARKPKT